MISPLENPDWRKAIIQEQLVRVAAFLLDDRRLRGFIIAPLTLYRHELLRVALSPFLPPFETPDESHLAQFLWICSPEFVPGESRAKRKFIKKCARTFFPPRKPRWFGLKRWQNLSDLRRAEFAALVALVREYISEALQDFPESDGSGGPSYYCDAAAICAAVGRNYGWNEKTTMALPMPRLLQYLNEIRICNALKNGEPNPVFNPSDKVRMDFASQIGRN